MINTITIAKAQAHIEWLKQRMSIYPEHIAKYEKRIEEQRAVIARAKNFR
jgi:hypothetical protein